MDGEGWDRFPGEEEAECQRSGCAGEAVHPRRGLHPCPHQQLAQILGKMITIPPPRAVAASGVDLADVLHDVVYVVLRHVHVSHVDAQQDDCEGLFSGFHTVHALPKGILPPVELNTRVEHTVGCSMHPHRYIRQVQAVDMERHGVTGL